MISFNDLFQASDRAIMITSLSKKYLKVTLAFALLACQLNISFAQAVTTNATSAIAPKQDDGQVIDVTQFGKLSFAEIKNLVKKDEIVDRMTDQHFKAYLAWYKRQSQLAIAEVDRKILLVLRKLVAIGNKIEKKFEPLIEQYAANTSPDDNAKYLLEKIKNNENIFK